MTTHAFDPESRSRAAAQPPLRTIHSGPGVGPGANSREASVSLRARSRHPFMVLLTRSIGLAGLCVFAKVSASLPVYAQIPQGGRSAAATKARTPNTRASGPRGRAPADATSTEDGTSDDRGPGSQPAHGDGETASRAGDGPQPAVQTLAQLGRRIGPSAEQGDPPGSRSVSGSPPKAAEKGQAGAQPEGAKSDRPARPGDAQGPPKADGRKISLEDEFVIEGKLEKPSAYYILRRSSLDYDWARLDARFSPLVLESAQDPLF